MTVVAVLMIGVGVYLMYYSWHSHTTGGAVTPVADAKQALLNTAIPQNRQAGQALV